MLYSSLISYAYVLTCFLLLLKKKKLNTLIISAIIFHFFSSILEEKNVTLFVTLDGEMLF